MNVDRVRRGSRIEPAKRARRVRGERPPEDEPPPGRRQPRKAPERADAGLGPRVDVRA